MPTFAFLNSVLLAALAAVAAPLLIHLLSRKRLPEIPIASTWLLREARRESLRHLRLHDYLLLALRTLIVALVVLAAARPAVKLAGAFGGRGSGSVVIVLDATASMNALAPGGATTVFDRARRRAEEIARQTSDGDAVELIVVRGSEIDNGASVRGRSAVLAALQRATPALGAGTLSMAAADAVRRAAAEKHANREVYVVSDFQGSALTDLEREMRAGAPGVRLILVPASEAPRGNIGIERVVASAGAPMRIEATIANHSPDDLTVPAEAIEHGLAPRRVSTRVGPHSRGVAVFAAGPTSASAVPAGAPPGVGEVRIPADALSADNVHHFVPAGRSIVRVLLVGREEAVPARVPGGLSPLAFPKLALTTASGSGASFSVSAAPPGALAEIDPARTDVVFLANPPRLSSPALKGLRDFREGGGAVFLSLGPGSDPVALNAELFPALAPATLRAGSDVERTDGSFLTLMPAQPGHPVFAGFRLGAGTALSGARFTRCVSLNPSGAAQTLARFGDGTPALVEADGVLVFGSSTDLSWGDFPASGSYLPFLQQAIAYLATGRARPPVSYFVGDRIPLRSLDGTASALLRCTGPNGEHVGIVSDAGRGGAPPTTAPVPAPGVWVLRAGDRVLERVAVNVDPRESDLSRPPDADLQRLFGQRNVSVLSLRDHVASYVGRLRHGRELWREFLLAALALLVIEQWLGRSRVRTSSAEGVPRAA